MPSVEPILLVISAQSSSGYTVCQNRTELTSQALFGKIKRGLGGKGLKLFKSISDFLLCYKLKYNELSSTQTDRSIYDDHVHSLILIMINKQH